MNKYVAFVFSSVCLFVAAFANIAVSDEPKSENEVVVYQRALETGVANALSDIAKKSINTIDSEVNKLRLINVPNSELLNKILLLQTYLNSEQYEKAEEVFKEIVEINNKIEKLNSDKETFYKKAKAAFDVKNWSKEEIDSLINNRDNEKDIVSDLKNWLPNNKLQLWLNREDDISSPSSAKYSRLKKEELSALKGLKKEDIADAIKNWDWDAKKMELIKLAAEELEAAKKASVDSSEETNQNLKNADKKFASAEALFVLVLNKCFHDYKAAKEEFNQHENELQPETPFDMGPLEKSKNELAEIKAQFETAYNNYKEASDNDKVFQNKLESSKASDEEKKKNDKALSDAIDKCNELKEKYKTALKNYNKLESEYNIYTMLKGLDFVAEDGYRTISSKIVTSISELKRLKTEGDNEIETAPLTGEMHNRIDSCLNKRNIIYQNIIKVNLINIIIDTKSKEQKTKAVKDAISQSVNSAFAVAYYKQGVNKKDSGCLNKSIEYAGKVSDPILSQYVQGLCYFEKTLLEYNSSNPSKAKDCFQKIVESSNQDDKPYYVQHANILIDLLSSSKSFIQDAKNETLAGNVDAAIKKLEVGHKIHPNDKALSKLLLDSCRRSLMGVSELKDAYNQYKGYLSNNKEALIAKSLFLSHIMDKALAADVEQYKSTVKEYQIEANGILNEINKSGGDDKLLMASVALIYSMSFANDELKNKALPDNELRKLIIRNYNNAKEPIKDFDNLEWHELLIKTCIAHGHVTLNVDQDVQQSDPQKLAKQARQNMIGIYGYMEANNLASHLPYNNGLNASSYKHGSDVFLGDALLMGVKKYNSDVLDKISQFQNEDIQNDLLKKIELIYALYLMNFSDIANANSANSPEYYRSLAMNEFVTLQKRLTDEEIWTTMLDSLRGLELVRSNNEQDAIAYLFSKYKVNQNNNLIDAVKDFENKIDSFCSEHASADLEKALLLFSLAEALHGFNMSFDLDEQPMFNNQPIDRPQLCNTTSDLYSKVTGLSNSNSLQYLNIMAERGNNIYKDDSYLISAINKYRSSVDTQPLHTIKFVKEGLRIHPDSHELRRLWYESESNLLRRKDMPDKSEHIQKLIKELDAFNKQQGRTFGVEMLRGLICKQQGNLGEAVSHFNNASDAADATPQDKALALSMSVQTENSMMYENDDNN